MTNNNEILDDIQWMRRMVSHNVRMPMAIIRGYGDVLSQGLLNEEEKSEAIDSICKNILYLDQIISVIFDNGTSDEVLVTKVNIAESLKTVIGYVSNIAKKSHINVNLNIESDEMYIDADPVAVLKIFYQIFENAFKYLGMGKSININVYSAGNDILVVYKDDGEGIEEEEITYILDKGFRGKNSSSKSGGGFGLYDVSETVKKCNGTMEVKSIKGKSFSIFIMFPKSV